MPKKHRLPFSDKHKFRLWCDVFLVVCLLYMKLYWPICIVPIAGSTLITVGEYQKRLGGAEREFLQTSAATFLTPLRNFLEGDWRTISVSLNDLHSIRLCVDNITAQVKKGLLPWIITDTTNFWIWYKLLQRILCLWLFFYCFVQKERRLLENRRLDLDICKARLKKAKQAEAKAAVSSISSYWLFFSSCLHRYMGNVFHFSGRTLKHPLGQSLIGSRKAVPYFY